MKTLLLLRHAKAERQADDADDHARRLTPEGEDAARAAGRHLAAHGPLPDLVLVSTAARTEATADLALAQLARRPAIRRDRGLYLAGVPALLAALAAVAEPASSVMLVGHNPEIGELAAALAAEGDRDLLAAVQDGFPTAALAVLILPIPSWRGVPGARGRLADFVTPKG